MGDLPNNLSLYFFSFFLPHPFFQMANGSRRHPTVQLKDKLKAPLSLVKVAPVQQREKDRQREGERGVGGLIQNPAICMNQEALRVTWKSMKVHLITHRQDSSRSFFIFALVRNTFLQPSSMRCHFILQLKADMVPVCLTWNATMRELHTSGCQ